MRHALFFLSLVWCASANDESDRCDFRRSGVIEGNITLGFMFPFFGSDNEMSIVCNESSIPDPNSIQLLEAAIFALQRGQSKIPGINIGLESYDSCSSAAVALDRSSFFLRDRFVGNLPEEIQGSCGEKLKPGFIGSLQDDLGVVVGSFLSNSFVTVTGYASDLPQLTTSKSYEYFTRTISSSQQEIQVWTKFMQAVKWTYVSVVYSTGESQLTVLKNFEINAKSDMICISQQYPLNITAGAGEMDTVYSSILQSDVDAVVLILDNDVGKEFLMAVARETNGRKMQFLAPYDLYLDLPTEVVSGNIAIVSAVPEILHTSNEDDGFDTYFKGLNPSSYNQIADPWFKYYWESSYNCVINGSSAEKLCGTNAMTDHVNNYQRNRFVTAVIDAIDTHIEALSNVLQCDEGQCDPSEIVITPEDYLEKLKEVDFSRSQGGENRRVAFTPSGDPEENEFRIWLSARNNETWIYSWSNGSLSLPKVDGITDLLSPSECGEPCADGNCFELRELEGEAEAYSGGDIILAGFFPVNEWDESTDQCGNLTGSGVLYVQAMLYAIDQINQDPTILPNIRIGMDGFNTCSSPQRATDVAYQLANQGVFGGSGSATRLSPDGERVEHFFGVIGPKSLEETTGVNQVLQSRKVMMVGYDADSPLINSYTYPYFARLLSSSVSSIQPFLQFMSRNNITYFQILYSGSRNQNPTATVVSYLESGSWTGVCTAQAIQIPASADGEEGNVAAWDDIFATLKKKPGARAVYLALSSEDILRVLQEMKKRGLSGEYFLLAGSSWELTEEDEASFADVIRGAVIITPLPRTAQGFEDYIRNLNLPDTRNPWFSDYCSHLSVGSGCTGPTTVFNDDLKDEAIPRIIDSVYAMASALHTIQGDLCPGTDRVCNNMLDADGDTIFEALTRKTLFVSRNDGRVISFDFSGSLNFVYEIFNYQVNDAVLKKEKIGQVANWQFTDETKVKFYDKSGTEILSDDDMGSRCNLATCEKECRRSDHDAVAEISMNGQGDVWLGGFFEVTEPALDPLQCTDEIIDENVPLVEAFLFAIEQINRSPDILPNLTLAGIAFDTCGSASRVIKEAGNLVAGTIDYRARYFNQQLNIFGVIGGGSSDTTRALSQTLANLGINQISYAATATEFSDPEQHPYVLRTVPSDEQQVAAFVDILASFAWNYVSIVYSDDLFGNDMLEEFRKTIAKDGSVCVAMTLKIQRSTFVDADYDSLITALQSNPNSRVVLMFTSDVDTRSVLQAANRMDVNDLQWIGSDTWGRNDYIIENTNNTALGALIISFESQSVPSFENYVNEIFPWGYRRNPWFQTFYSDYFECDLSLGSGYGTWCNTFLNTFPGEVISKNPLVVTVINAVNAYAYGLQSALETYCEDEIHNHICSELQSQPEELHRIIQETMYPSAHDDSILSKFNQFGDSPGKYDILNIQTSEDGTASYKKVGSWIEGNLNFTGDPLFSRNGESVASPTQCVGRCTECRVQDFSYISLDGPIQIVGLAGVHNAGDHVNECGDLSNTGVVDVEAFLFAIDYVNSQEDILPRVQLGAKILDTCQSSSRGIRELSSFLGGAGVFADRTDWEWIGGIINGGVPSVMESGYLVAEQYKHPQVVYSPSPPTLDDADFLIKTSPTVTDQIQAILEILQTYGWTFISVIADSSDKQQMLLYNTFIQSAGELCLDQNLTFTADTLDSTLSSLQGPARVVVMFASAAVVNNIKKSTVSYHKTFIFAGVGSHEDINTSEAIAGSLILSFTQTSPAFRDFLNMQLTVEALNSSRNPWLPEYISRKLSCNVGDVTKFAANCDDGAAVTVIDQSEVMNAKFIVNSIVALARSLSLVQSEMCGASRVGLCSNFVTTTEEKFLDAITNIGPFTDENGEQVVFQNGQQLVNISVWNISPENGNNFVKIDGNDPFFVDENGKSTGTVKSVCPLEATAAKQPTTSPQDTTQPTTTPQDTKRPTAAPQETKRPTTAGKTKPAVTPKMDASGGPSLALREDYHGDSWFIIALVCSGIGIICTIIVAVIFFKKSERMYAQFHSSFLVYLILLAVLVMFLQTILFGLPINLVVCTLRRIIPGVSFFSCFLSIFLMSVRFFRVRKKDNLGSGLGTKYIDNKSQAIAAACILPIESIVLLQWLLYEPPADGARDEDNIIHCVNINSTFPVSFLPTYILMVGGIAVAFLGLKRRKTLFAAELTSIIICIAFSFVIGAAWIVCCILLEGEKGGVLVVVTAFAGIFQGFVVLFTIFPPIIRGLLRKEEFQVDSMSVVDGDSGFTNPVSALETADEVSPTPSADAKAIEAGILELHGPEEESNM